MSKINIGVDVDLVLASSDMAWMKWLCKVTGAYINLGVDFNPPYYYNLGKYFENYLEDIDPMDFWRNEGVYDWVDPVPGSQRALAQLKNEIDCKIIAVSHCKGNHFKSKWQFLKRNFGDNIDSYVVTKEKEDVRVDYLIDDRNEYLNRMPENVTCIRFSTPYEQNAAPEKEIIEKSTWDDIVKYFRDYYS